MFCFCYFSLFDVNMFVVLYEMFLFCMLLGFWFMVVFCILVSWFDFICFSGLIVLKFLMIIEFL